MPTTCITPGGYCAGAAWPAGEWLDIRSLAHALVAEHAADWPGASVDYVVYYTAALLTLRRVSADRLAATA